MASTAAPSNRKVTAYEGPVELIIKKLSCSEREDREVTKEGKQECSELPTNCSDDI